MITRTARTNNKCYTETIVRVGENDDGCISLVKHAETLSSWASQCGIASFIQIWNEDGPEDVWVVTTCEEYD
jgi:hypothetical protein